MLLKKNLFLLFACATLIYISLLIPGCTCNSEKPDVTRLAVNIRAERFEKDLFSLKRDDIHAGIKAMRNKYGNFFNLFIHQITAIGSPDSVMTADHLLNFIADSNFRSIYNDCEKLFDDFSWYDEKLSDAFRYYSYYFPDKKIPLVVTMISGFSYPVVCDSTSLGISLDMYLGADYKYYSTIEPPLPVYLRNRMRKEYIVSDAMKGWAQSDYGIDESSARMLDFMVSQGRILYYLDKVVPDENDTIKSGYSSTQLKWCKANEKNIWSFFIENKLLFSFDPNLMNKYVNDGPTTNGFPKDAPGNIGQFIGWQVVKSYMNSHKEVTLEKLMNEKSMQKIFDESNYKPGK